MPSTPHPDAVRGEVRQGPLDPRMLRSAALALPALATLLGYVLPRRPAARLAVGLGALALPAGAAGLVVAAGGARRRSAAPTEGEAASAASDALVTIVVPARDEGAVIGRLIADLGAARCDPMALIVVDDASCDGLAALACAAFGRCGLADVGRVIRLTTPSGSKGAALSAVPVPASGIVVVLDADARVGRDFVARSRAAGSSASAAQARRRMLMPVAGWGFQRAAALLALVQDGEQEIDGLIARARLALGGASEFRGDGMVIRAEALAALGGWSADALCEDLELATRWYLATGRGVERPAGLEIWEQPVLRMRVLLAQRLRWAEGSIRRDIRLVLPALFDRRQPVRRRVELAAYASQALMPWVALGIALASRGCPGSYGEPHADPCEPQRAARRTLVTLASGYALAALVLAWGSQADAAGPGLAGAETDPMPRTLNDPTDPAAELGRPPRTRRHRSRLGRAAVVTAFASLWALVLPVAWLRVAARPGAPQFVRTPHAAPSRFSEPGSGSPLT